MKGIKCFQNYHRITNFSIDSQNLSILNAENLKLLIALLKIRGVKNVPIYVVHVDMYRKQ